MKKLALDFDGVLSDTTNSWVNAYNERFLDKPKITSRHIDEWESYKKLGITLDECFELFSEAWSDWRNLKPLEPHLKQKTKMLSNIIDVDIVTAVQPNHLGDIEKWLTYHQISYNEIVHSHAKHELGYDIYIDDAVRNIMKVVESGKYGLIMNQPWNRELNDNYSYSGINMIRRVYNMYHAIDVVRELI